MIKKIQNDTGVRIQFKPGETIWATAIVKQSNVDVVHVYGLWWKRMHHAEKLMYDPNPKLIWDLKTYKDVGQTIV